MQTARSGDRPDGLRDSALFSRPGQKKATSRHAEFLNNVAIYDAGADGGRFDHPDMKLQLASRRLGFFWLNQIRLLHAHRLAQSDGADYWPFAYCIAAVLNTASRGPVRITESSVATWPGLDSATLRLELAKVGIRLAEREMARLITEVTSRRNPIGKVELGRRLQLTEVERELVDARNIQAVDHSEAAKLARARKADAAKHERARRADGVVERSEWLKANDVSRTKPWEAEGISRRTWYRRKSCIKVAAIQSREDFGIETEASAVQGDRPKETLGTHATSVNRSRSNIKLSPGTPLDHPTIAPSNGKVLNLEMPAPAPTEPINATPAPRPDAEPVEPAATATNVIDLRARFAAHTSSRRLPCKVMGADSTPDTCRDARARFQSLRPMGYSDEAWLAAIADAGRLGYGLAALEAKGAGQ